VSDVALLKQHAAHYLPRRMARELAAQIDQMLYLNALAEAASNDQATILYRFTMTLGDAMDEIDERLISRDRLTPDQERELDAQIDLVLAQNRQLLDEAHEYALQVIRDERERLQAPKRSGWEEFAVGLSGSEDNWNALKKVWGG
jgi:hypothetical protein